MASSKVISLLKRDRLHQIASTEAKKTKIQSSHLRDGLGRSALIRTRLHRIAVGKRGEAPPGFEPGMADLQSAALIP